MRRTIIPEDAMHHHSDRDQVALVQVISELKEDLLTARCGLRGPEDPYVVQLRKDIARDHAKPSQMIVAMTYRDLKDGAAPDRVRRFALRLLAFIDANAPEHAPGVPYTLGELQQLETEAEGRLNRAQMAVALRRTTSTLRELEEAALAYGTIHGQLLLAVGAERYQVCA